MRNWSCPFCNRLQTRTNASYSTGDSILHPIGGVEGKLGISWEVSICANPDCKKTSVRLRVASATIALSGEVRFTGEAADSLFLQRIIPSSEAKLQPDYIPASIREDYEEACRIRDLSPKASATLIRRCIQGVIRDIAGISDGTLAKEIDKLREGVEQNTVDRLITLEAVEAIDNVRKVGAIGAHMERDVNLIVSVEPHEAQMLIELAEMLFEDWYVARHDRQSRLMRLAKLADGKRSIQKRDGGGS